MRAAPSRGAKNRTSVLRVSEEENKSLERTAERLINARFQYLTKEGKDGTYQLVTKEKKRHM